MHQSGSEETHQFVLEGEKESALAGVSLAAGATPKLVVDAARLVALGPEHVQAAQLADLVAVFLALGNEFGLQLGDLCLAIIGLGIASLGDRLAQGEALGVTTEEDVDAPAGHVRGHGDRMEAPGLGHDLGFLGVLLGIENGVRDPLFFQQPGENLGFLDRRRTHQHRLTGPEPLLEILDDRLELGLLGLVDQVALVVADHVAVGWDRHHREVVGVGELRRFGLSSSRHPRELFVLAEVVLEGDGCPGVVFLLDLHPLLRLDRLVQTVGPAPPVEDAARELVDDLHLVVGDDVVLVAPVEFLGPESLLELVDQVGGDHVVQVRDAELLLDLLDSIFGGGDSALLLVDLVVGLALKGTDDPRELVIELGGLSRRTRDDERGSGLVDEDRVDFVDDAEYEAALHLSFEAAGHVVAEVVEAELGVRAVGDVAVVRLLLQVPVVHVGHDQAHGDPHETVDPSHPLGVAAGEIVVGRDHVHATLGEAVQIHGEGRGDGLALPRLHLGDPAEVEGGAPHQLHVVVALADDPAGGLAGDGEGLDQEGVQILSVVEPLAKFDGLVNEVVVGQLLEFGFEGVDIRDDRLEGADLFALTRAEDLGEDAHGGAMLPAGPARRSPAYQVVRAWRISARNNSAKPLSCTASSTFCCCGQAPLAGHVTVFSFTKMAKV